MRLKDNSMTCNISTHQTDGSLKYTNSGKLTMLVYALDNVTLEIAVFTPKHDVSVYT